VLAPCRDTFSVKRHRLRRWRNYSWRTEEQNQNQSWQLLEINEMLLVPTRRMIVPVSFHALAKRWPLSVLVIFCHDTRPKYFTVWRMTSFKFASLCRVPITWRCCNKWNFLQFVIPPSWEMGWCTENSLTRHKNLMCQKIRGGARGTTALMGAGPNPLFSHLLEDIGDFYIPDLEMTHNGQSRSKVKIHFY